MLTSLRIIWFRITRRIPLYNKFRLDSEWLEGYEQGVKASSIGIERDPHGRFRKAE